MLRSGVLQGCSGKPFSVQCIDCLGSYSADLAIASLRDFNVFWTFDVSWGRNWCLLARYPAFKRMLSLELNLLFFFILLERCRSFCAAQDFRVYLQRWASLWRLLMAIDLLKWSLKWAAVVESVVACLEVCQWCRVARDNAYNPSQLQVPFYCSSEGARTLWLLGTLKDGRFKESEY